MRPLGVYATRLLVVGLVGLLAPAALADPGAGMLGRAGEIPRLKVKGDGKLELPLEHTDVRAEVTGFVARVEVTQTYGNPFDRPIEAVYVFPLPDDSAVDDLKMVIGSRVIEAEVQKREDARRTYEDARRRGQTAALLEQERPNIFTQSIANIAPHEKVRVVIRYVQALTYDEGSYEFVFPMVVGPRYLPGAPLGGAPSGGGSRADTTQVPDAARISPFVVPEGLRSGHDVSLAVSVDAGLPVREFSVPTHEVEASRPGARQLLVRLVDRDSVPNRDFVLRWAVAGDRPQATLLTHKGSQAGYFTLLVQPPALDVAKLVGQRELIFVVDTSGSMGGLPIWLCQQAMRDALRRLRPGDTFNVLSFAGATAQAFERPRRASQENVADGLAFVERMQSGGGTELLNAVDAALKPEVEGGRRRYVFFLTDGFVGNDEQITAATRTYVAALERKGQRGRVFSYGVGSSPNRNLLEGIARQGKGLAFYATNREDPVRGVVRFFRQIDHPVLEDVSLDWGTLPVSHVHPAPMPDLFLSRPLVVHGRYEVGAVGRVVVRGYADGRKVELPLEVTFPSEPHGSPALASLWARAEIADDLADLAFRRLSGQSYNEAAVRETVTGLGLSHRLVTPFTSFVAVDRSRTVGDGHPVTVQQPVEVPEDVDGTQAGAAPMGAVGSKGLLGTIGGGSGYALGNAVGDAAGFGGLGLSGTGAGGGGRGALSGRGGGGGSYAGFGSKGKAGGSLLSAAVIVRGSLDRTMIQRVIRQNLGQVKYLYELALRRNPKLAGRIVIRFVIQADGTVQSATVVEGTLREPLFESGLLARVRTWRFPAVPGGGTVAVNYPIVLTPGQ